MGSQKLWKFHPWRDSNLPLCSHEQSDLTLMMSLLWANAGSETCWTSLPAYVILRLCGLAISDCQWLVCHWFPGKAFFQREKIFESAPVGCPALPKNNASIWSLCTVLLLFAWGFLYMENLKFPFLGVLLFCLVYRISTVLLKISIADCWVEPTLFYWSLFWDNPVEGQEGLLTLLNLSSPAMWWMGLRGPLTPRASGLRPSVSRRQVSVGMQKDKRWFPIFQMSWKLKIKLVVFC